MNSLTNIKNDEYWEIGKDDSITTVKKELAGNSDKVGTLYAVLQKSQTVINSSCDKDSVSMALRNVERRYVHIKDKIEGKNFFHRTLIHLMMFLKGQDLDSSFNSFQQTALQVLNVNKRQHLLQTINDPGADPNVRDAAIKEVCSGTKPFDPNIPKEKDSISRLQAFGELNCSPSPSFVLLYTTISRARDWCNDHGEVFKKKTFDETVYRNKIEHDPTDSRAFFNLNYVLMEKGEFDEAEKMLRMAEKPGPRPPGSYFEPPLELKTLHEKLGDILVLSGKYGEAEDAFRAVIKEDKDNSAVAKKIEELLKITNKIPSSHEDSTVFLRVGDALRLAGKYERAEAMLRRAIELDPQNSAAIARLGDVLREMGKSDEAESFLRRAVEQDSKDLFALFSLRELLKATGKYDAEKETLFKDMLQLDELMILVGCYGRQLLSEELPAVVQKVEQQVHEKPNDMRHWKEELEKGTQNLNAAALIIQDSYLPFSSAVNILPNMYDLVKRISITGWGGKFYEEGTPQSEWRKTFNSYYDEVDAIAGVKTVQKKDERFLRFFRKDELPSNELPSGLYHKF